MMNVNMLGCLLKDNLSKIEFISGFEKRVISSIMDCRTAKMGGRVEKCDCCGHEIILYNSCRNRNCPNCQGERGIKWVNDRTGELLPVSYFHTVFTIPEELKPIFLHNKGACFKILFKSVSKALTQIAARRKNLGAQIGFMAILHTWDQKLNFHPHIHCVIAGGGISKDRSKWISANKNYLFPIKILSKVFKGKLLFYLNKAFKKGILKWDQQQFSHICATISRKEWVVFSKRPFGGALQVLSYLSRYTHRVGISNKRILSYDEKNVTFTWRDRNENKQKQLTIPVELFIKRFMMHILPKRFTKIRFYGFMVNRHRKRMIKLCRELILKKMGNTEELLPEIPLTKITDYSLCPKCRKGHLQKIMILDSA